MTHDKIFDELLSGLIAGELDDSQLEQLEQHAAECNECAEMLSAHQLLRQTASQIESPAADEFQKMRQEEFESLYKF